MLKKIEKISLLCLLIWRYDKYPLARTTPVSNIFSWSQRVRAIAVLLYFHYGLRPGGGGLVHDRKVAAWTKEKMGRQIITYYYRPDNHVSWRQACSTKNTLVILCMLRAVPTIQASDYYLLSKSQLYPHTNFRWIILREDEATLQL